MSRPTSREAKPPRLTPDQVEASVTRHFASLNLWLGHGRKAHDPNLPDGAPEMAWFRSHAEAALARAQRKALVLSDELKSLPVARRRRIQRAERTLIDVLVGIVGRAEVGGMPDPLPDALRSVVREYAEAREAGRALAKVDQLRFALAILAALPARDYPTPLLLLHAVNIHEIADRLEAETAAEKGRRSGGTSRIRSPRNPADAALLEAAQALRAKHPNWSLNRIAEQLAEQPKWKALVASRATENASGKRRPANPAKDAIRKRLERAGF